MDSSRQRVIVSIEPRLLSSAIEQLLAHDPRLEVETGPTCFDHLDDETTVGREARAIRVALLDDPFQFELKQADNSWTVDYRGLNELAELISELAQRGTCT